MISVSNLAKVYGDRTLFAGVSLMLNAGERYGLVGANGSGKTTLLNILGGELEASDGEVSLPKRARVGVLRQDQFLYEEHPILNVTLMGHRELWQVLTEKEALLAKAGESFDADRFAELEARTERLDGYTAESRAATILEGLGLPARVHHDPLSTLSGGFRLRVLLAQVLAGDPDALLLDEPTNHLDILAIRWLETWLRDFPGMLVVISHDHRFLDNVATRILDVDYETVQQYTGDYTAFLKAKVGERERREKAIASREREIAHHQQFVDRFRAKATKARQATSKLRTIEKITEGMEELPVSSRRYPTFKLDSRRDSGRQVLTVKGVKKAFGDNEVLHGVDLSVQRGDRLAVMGANGIGKSTLLKIVMGDLAPDAGTVEWGYETHPGYFAQDHRERFQPDLTAEAWAWETSPDQSISFVRGHLGLVLFSGDDVEKRLKDLSGGEATRLVFCRLAMERPNVLVLDEPTNHLDLESIHALVEGLQTYRGTVLLVSHDRWLVSRLATRIVEIREDEIRDFHGSYEEYVSYCGDDHLDADRVVLKARAERRRKAEPGPGGNGRRRSRKAAGEGREQRQAVRREEKLAGLLERVETTESRLREIDAAFCEAGFYERTPPEEVRRLKEERSRLERRVSDLTKRWETLAEESGAG